EEREYNDDSFDDEVASDEEGEEEEFIVLLEENGKMVAPSPSQTRRGRRRGKVLAILSKAKAAAKLQKHRIEENTSSTQRLLCLVFFSIVVVLLAMLFGVSFYAQAGSTKLSEILDEKLEMKVAFQIAQGRFRKRLHQAVKTNYNTTNGDFHVSSNGYVDLKESPFKPTNPTQKNKVVNSIRVPKAGSSELSVTARALAGCHPDGFPCCRLPGDPVGSCPRDGLACPSVTGCGDHRPNFSGTEPIISNIREPSARLQSGFFYYPPHRPALKKGHDWKVFKRDYIKNPVFQNVMTKMFSGYYAYNEFDPKRHTVKHAKKNVCRTAWFGQVEYPILSSLLLYEARAFQLLVPNPVAFGLPATDGSIMQASKNASSVVDLSENQDGGLRINSDEEYATFKSSVFPDNNGMDVVRKYNQADFELHDFMQQVFCARVKSVSGLIDDARRANIAATELEACRVLLSKHNPGGTKKHPKTTTLADLCPKNH
ncbi:MAG: hypothetical protein SGILL_008638, partial [Bacillariaceae sp.]